MYMRWLLIVPRLVRWLWPEPVTTDEFWSFFDEPTEIGGESEVNG